MDNMIAQDLVIGIDVSASWVDLFCFSGQVPESILTFYQESTEFEKYHSQWPIGIEVVRHIAKLQPMAVILEPTGSYFKYLCEKLTYNLFTNLLTHCPHPKYGAQPNGKAQEERDLEVLSDYF